MLSGTNRPRNERPDEPKPEGNLFAPPPWMSESQKDAWRYAIDNSPPGLLRNLDRDLLASWVTAQDDFRVAEIELQQSGLVVKQGGSERTTTNPDGSVVKTVRSDSLVPSPWTKIRNEAFQRLIKATSELGFSPTSRSRITLAGGGKKETNRFANNAANRRS